MLTHWIHRPALLGALLAGLLAGTQAEAETLDIEQLGAALALPFITGGAGVAGNDDAVTLTTITNGRNAPVTLLIDVINGDPSPSGELCSSLSVQCSLTGRETALFVFSPNGSGATLDVECTDLDSGNVENVAKSLDAQNGILFVAVADGGTSAPISEDLLLGDAVVVDFEDDSAYAFGAIAFQAGSGQNDGNKVYRFDGVEYAQFPRSLVGGGDEVILFTLDFTVGQPAPPRARLGSIAIDGSVDGGALFECFDILSAGGILTPQPIGTFDAHDVLFGDGNEIRTRAVHGWAVEGSGGMPLAQTTTSLMPFLDDQDPVFNADTGL